MRRFKGFTLTELMVSLAVIGIIVAVVTPAIVRLRPNKTKMMVKKTFYTTEQIVSTLINDQRFYPDMHLACDLDAGAVDYECAWGFDYEESKIGMYDYIIKNNNLEKTVQIIMTIINNEYNLKEAEF